MKLIIPMAGMGSRLRPLTLTTPKPLLKIAGKTILEHLVDNIKNLSNETITDIGFIIGNFPFNISPLLNKIANNLNAKSHIFIQEEPLGTAHAIFQAKSLLNSKVIIAYADTIFYSTKKLDLDADSVIFTKKVEDPTQYGIVKKQDDKIIDFVEKPKHFISNEAIIGIYYFKQGELLYEVINNIISNKLLDNDEYQLTRGLKMLIDNKLTFNSLIIDQWLDTGNPHILLSTQKQILSNSNFSEINSNISNSKIIEPVYIGNNVEISNSVIGPYVSIEDNSKIQDSKIANSIIYNNVNISKSKITASLIGSNSVISNIANSIYVSDYTKII